MSVEVCVKCEPEFAIQLIADQVCVKDEPELLTEEAACVKEEACEDSTRVGHVVNYHEEYKLALSHSLSREPSCGSAGATEAAVRASVPADLVDEPALSRREPSCAGVSELAVLAGLYADHVVKDELVLGPELPHRPQGGLVVHKTMQEQPRARASSDQYLTLLEYMERHGDISRQQPTAQGRARSDKLWKDLASLLNSHGGGVYKKNHKWKKVWSDWKTKTKSKAIQIRNHANGTGGGPHSRKRLNDLEERVLAVMGEAAVVGQDNAQERGLSQTGSQQAQAQPTRDEFDFDAYSIKNLPIHYSPPPGEQPGSSSAPMGPLRGESAPVGPRLQESQTGISGTVRPIGEALEPDTFEQSAQESLMYTATRSQTPAPRSPSSVASSPGAQGPRARRRRPNQTPFDRAVTEFVAVEQRRLQFEETREQLLHQREMERLAIERMQVDVFRTVADMGRRVADVGQALLAYLARDDTG